MPRRKKKATQNPKELISFDIVTYESLVKELQSANTKAVEKIVAGKGRLSMVPNLRDGFDKLQVIDLRHCNIEKIDVTHLPPRVTELDFWNNEMSTISDLSEFKWLKVFNIGANRLSEIQGKYLPESLENFSFRDNEVEKMPDLSHLTKLKTLEISVNKVSEIPTEYLPKSLRIFYCERLKIEKLPDLSHLKELQRLHMDDGMLSEIPTGHLPESLEVISCNRNKLQELPDLKSLVKLRQLDIDTNNIKQILANCLPCSLTNFSARYNQIENFPNLGEFQDLVTFDLEDNNICNLTEPLPETQCEVILTENPIKQISQNVIDIMGGQSFGKLKKIVSKLPLLQSPPRKYFEGGRQVMREILKIDEEERILTENLPVENFEDFQSLLFGESNSQKSSEVPKRQKPFRSPKLKASVLSKPVAIVPPDSHEAPTVPVISDGAMGQNTQWDQQQNPNLASVLTQEIASTEVTTLKTEVSNLKQVLQEKETQIKTLINTLNENSKNMTDLLTTFKQQIQQMTTRNAELESRLKLQQVDRDHVGAAPPPNMEETYGNREAITMETDDHSQECGGTTGNSHSQLSDYVNPEDIRTVLENAQTVQTLVSNLLSLLFTPHELATCSATEKGRKPLDRKKVQALKDHVKSHFEVTDKDMTQAISKNLMKSKRGRKSNRYTKASKDLHDDGSVQHNSPENHPEVAQDNGGEATIQNIIVNEIQQPLAQSEMTSNENHGTEVTTDTVLPKSRKGKKRKVASGTSMSSKRKKIIATQHQANTQLQSDGTESECQVIHQTVSSKQMNVIQSLPHSLANHTGNLGLINQQPVVNNDTTQQSLSIHPGVAQSNQQTAINSTFGQSHNLQKEIVSDTLAHYGQIIQQPNSKVIASRDVSVLESTKGQCQTNKQLTSTDIEGHRHITQQPNIDDKTGHVQIIQDPGSDASSSVLLMPQHNWTTTNYVQQAVYTETTGGDQIIQIPATLSDTDAKQIYVMAGNASQFQQPKGNTLANQRQCTREPQLINWSVTQGHNSTGEVKDTESQRDPRQQARYCRIAPKPNNDTGCLAASVTDTIQLEVLDKNGDKIFQSNYLTGK